MGRPPKLSEPEILEAALNLFWQCGFHQVSTRDLAGHLDLNVSSLYSRFGNKAGLFDAVVDHYEQFIVPHYIGALETPSSTEATVKNVLAQFGSYGAQHDAPGCLITTAAVDAAPDPTTSAGRLDRYSARLRAAYQRGLARPANPDDRPLHPDTITQLADMFVATTLGLFVMIRAHQTESIVAAVAAATQMLEQARTDRNRSPETTRKDG